MTVLSRYLNICWRIQFSKNNKIIRTVHVKCSLRLVPCVCVSWCSFVLATLSWCPKTKHCLFCLQQFFLEHLETNETIVIPAVLPLPAASRSSYLGLAGIVGEVPSWPPGMVPGYRNLEGKFVMR